LTRLLLVRHGETDWNQEGRWQGQADVPLNQNGLDQANRTADLLEDQPIAAIYTSDLQRARRTAEILAEKKHIPVKIDPRLREIHQGIWQGMLVSDIEQKFEQEFKDRRKDPLMVAAPGGENALQVRERVLSALEDIQAAYPTETVAIISHGFALAVARAHFLGVPIEQVWELVPKNGEIIVLDIPANGHIR
jgi:alpha-ribazole phosphatase